MTLCIDADGILATSVQHLATLLGHVCFLIGESLVYSLQAVKKIVCN